MVQVDVSGFGNAIQAANKKSNNLYWTQNTPLGDSKGLRQYYRYGLYSACSAERADPSRVRVPEERGRVQLVDDRVRVRAVRADARGHAHQAERLQEDDAGHHPVQHVQEQRVEPRALERGERAHLCECPLASCLVTHSHQIASILTFFALVLGLVKHRLFFFAAAVCAGVAAFFLMVGAAIWTSIVAKDSWLKIVKVEGGTKLGILVTAGPGLYLTWVSFVLVSLSVAPYVISCCTFRKAPKVGAY
jgi:hypothetical protein